MPSLAANKQVAPLTRSVPLASDSQAVVDDAQVPSAQPRLPRSPIAEPAELARDERESHLFDEFFSWPPPPVDYTPPPFEPAPMSRVSRWAMWATVSMLSASLIGFGSFIAYRNFIMPAPAELSDADATLTFDLPTPILEPDEQQQLAAAAPTRSDLRARLARPEDLAREAEETAAAFLADDLTEDQADDQLEPAAGAEGSQPTAAQETSLAAATDPQLAAAQPAAAQPAAAQPAAAQPAAAQPAAAQPAAALGAVAADDNASFDELLARARKLSEQGETKQAVLLYERALEPRPHAIEALLGKAAGLLALGDFDAAKSTAQQAVALDSGNGEGLMIIGASWEKLGNKDAAKDVYQRCIEQSADDQRHGTACRERLAKLGAQ